MPRHPMPATRSRSRVGRGAVCLVVEAGEFFLKLADAGILLVMSDAAQEVGIIVWRHHARRAEAVQTSTSEGEPEDAAEHRDEDNNRHPGRFGHTTMTRRRL